MRNNAPLPAITGPVARITQQVIVHSQLCNVTFDYMSTVAAVIGTADLLNLGSNWVTNFGANFRACMSQDASWVGYTVARLDVNTVPTGVFNISPAQAGTEAAASHPTDVCITLGRGTSVRGQHGQGRVLLPGVPLSFVTPATDPNRLNAAGVLAVGSFKDNLRGVLTVGLISWVPVISTRPIAPATVVSKAGQVVTSVTRTILGTCRRRREGRGI